MEVRAMFRTTHPLTGKVVFDSWLTLCEYALDVAEKEAKERLIDKLIELTEQIADEIIESVEECEPEAI